MAAASAVTIRPARRDDVGTIFGVLANDAPGSGRERIEEPLQSSLRAAMSA